MPKNKVYALLLVVVGLWGVRKLSLVRARYTIGRKASVLLVMK